MVSIGKVHIGNQQIVQELLAFRVLQFAVTLRYTNIQVGSLETLVLAPLVAVRHEKCPSALANILPTHDEPRPRAVNAAAFVSQLMRRFVGAKDDDSVDTVLETEDWPILFGPILVDSPRIALRRLMQVPNDRQWAWPRRQSFAFARSEGGIEPE
jgi:hypothetical protein